MTRVRKELQKTDIRLLTQTELCDFVSKNGEKPFRSKQLYQWLWKHFIESFNDINNIPKTFVSVIEKNFNLTVSELISQEEADDGTLKMGFKLYDGEIIEAVLIPASSRLTACISSQAGCPVKCNFCATGMMGFKRNLSTPEIYAQFVKLNQIALHKFGTNITNIVIMGMGEPLLNYEQIKRFINIINSSEGHNFSSKRITLSTVGIPDGIKKMADDNIKVKLAVSLHAPTNEKRNMLIPINKTYPIETLFECLQYYYKKTKNLITFEYVLLRDFNDSRTNALQLATLCRKIPCKVNVIEFNTFEGVKYQKSEETITANFCRILGEQGINCLLRKSKGNTISAACGQLSNSFIKD